MMQQAPDRTRLPRSVCYDFPNANRLTLALPDGWVSTCETPAGAVLPELHVGPAGEPHRLLISIIALGRDQPGMTMADLREQVQASVDAQSATAVQEVIDIHDIQSLNAAGYVYRLTDAHPRPGEYLYMTQGTLIVGATNILFTLLTNAGEADLELTALSIVQGSKLTFDANTPCPSQRFPQATQQATLDDFLAIRLASEACLFVQDSAEILLNPGNRPDLDGDSSSPDWVAAFCLQRVAASGPCLALGPADFLEIDDELRRLLRILVVFDRPEGRPTRHKVLRRLEALDELSGNDFKLRSYLRLALIEDLIPRGSASQPDSTNRACAMLREIISSLPGVPDRFLKARAQALLLAFMLPSVSGRVVASIEDGIEAGLEALQTLNGSGLIQDWALLQLHLGIAYASRVFGDRRENVNEAVVHYEKALAQGGATLAIQRAANSNTGLAFLELAQGTDLPLLQRARDRLQTALTLAEKDADPWAVAGVQLNLGNANLALADKDVDALESAIALYLQAEAVLTRDSDPGNWAGLQHNLGEAYAQRQIGKDADNSAAAIEHFGQALELRTIAQDPLGCMFTNMALAHAYMRRSDFDTAATHCSAAIQADRILSGSSMLRTEMRAQFERSRNLYGDTAYCLLKLGRRMQALATAELGRARELQQLLRARSQEPENTFDPSVAYRTILDCALNDMTPLSSDSREVEDRRHFYTLQKREMQAALAKLDDPVQETTAEPAQLTPEQLLASIETDHVLVMPIVSQVGSATLILKAGAEQLTAADVVWHGGFSLTDARELLLGSKRLGLATGWIPAYFGNKKDERTWKSVISATGRLLWVRLLSEVWDALRVGRVGDSAQLVIVAPAFLTLLPWHGAWRGSDGRPRFACEDYAIGYAPSLTVYASLQRRSAMRAVTPVQRMRSLVVADSDLQKPLPFAALEGLQVSRMAGTQPEDLLCGEDSSFVAVSRGVKDKDLLHFACHGYFFPHDAMWSYLALGRSGTNVAGTTGNLRLREILGWSDVRARLVTLSACESAITELDRLPNESLSLASAWLSSGALAVVSTLWQVDDFCTVVLMKRFYTEYLGSADEARGLDGRGLVALRNAQLWLKSATAPELVNSVASFQAEPGLNAEQSRLLAQRRAAFEAMPPEAQPYSEPYWWSAFTYSGI